jgi:prepilin-type N-terminal cleavage/methylation domain-containing protein
MMKRRYDKGFTLVELLIVIAIIGLLMAMLGVLIQGLLDRAKYAKTNSIVQALESSCKNYKTDYGEYPPVSMFGNGNSMNLHWYLGRQRYVSQGYSSGGGGFATKRPGYIDFPSDWLETGPSSTYPQSGNVFKVIDAWVNPITYQNPSPNVPAGGAPSFRIVSTGADVTDPDDDTTSDSRDF